MAFFTRSFLIRPTLNRFSTNSRLVEPEQYHAIEVYLFAVLLDASARAVLILSMQGGCIVLFFLVDADRCTLTWDNTLLHGSCVNNV